MIEIKKSEDRIAILEIISEFCGELKYDESVEKTMREKSYSWNNFIAYKNGQVAGGFGCSNQGTYILGEYLWVNPKYRNTCVGGLLFKKIIHGKATQMVIVTKEKIGLYQKIGFDIEGYMLTRSL